MAAAACFSDNFRDLFCKFNSDLPSAIAPELTINISLLFFNKNKISWTRLLTHDSLILPVFGLTINAEPTFRTILFALFIESN